MMTKDTYMKIVKRANDLESFGIEPSESVFSIFKSYDIPRPTGSILIGGALGALRGGFTGWGISRLLGADRTARILSAVGGALAGGALGAYIGDGLGTARNRPVNNA